MNRTIILAALALASCATSPASIQPLVGTKCPAGAAQRLAILTAEQQRAATGDAVSVALIGIPTSAFSAERKAREQEIALLKGCH